MTRAETWTPRTLEERIERVEALDQIRQLAHRYALALDTRNMDDLVELFVEDVRVGKDAVGREALKRWFTETMSRYKTSVHFVGNHVIDFDSADRARGVVYCRDELERPGEWKFGYLQYWDTYERRGGLWYFVRRRFFRWFLVDALSRPSHGAGASSEELETGLLPDAWPSWDRFWREQATR